MRLRLDKRTHKCSKRETNRRWNPISFARKKTGKLARSIGRNSEEIARNFARRPLRVSVAAALLLVTLVGSAATFSMGCDEQPGGKFTQVIDVQQFISDMKDVDLAYPKDVTDVKGDIAKDVATAEPVEDVPGLDGVEPVPDVPVLPDVKGDIPADGDVGPVPDGEAEVADVPGLDGVEPVGDAADGEADEGTVEPVADAKGDVPQDTLTAEPVEDVPGLDGVEPVPDVPVLPDVKEDLQGGDAVEDSGTQPDYILWDIPVTQDSDASETMDADADLYDGDYIEVGPYDVYDGAGDTAQDTVLPEWLYCTEITINGEFPAGYSHQIDLESSGLDLGLFNPDGSDVRFYEGGCDSPDTTVGQLNHWIEVWEPGVNTNVWVKTETSNIPLVSLYYGNLNAPDVSDVEGTFKRVVGELKASWNFDEGEGSLIHDGSGNSYLGIMVGDVQWSSGVYGTALEFGTPTPQYVQISEQVVNSAANFSLEAWFNINSGGKNHSIITEISNENIEGEFNLYVLSSNDRLRFARRTGKGNEVYLIDSDTTITPGTWYHAVAVYYGNGLADAALDLYVDGVAGGILDQNTYGSADNSTTKLGRSDANDSYNMDGIIDETRVYGRALSPDEIVDLYGCYGYTTSNYPGFVLLRLNASPEPTYAFLQ